MLFDCCIGLVVLHPACNLSRALLAQNSQKRVLIYGSIVIISLNSALSRSLGDSEFWVFLESASTAMFYFPEMGIF